MNGGEPTLGEVYRLLVKVDHTLHGNGQPGLVKTVEKHDAWLRVLGAGLLVVAGAVLRTVFA